MRKQVLSLFALLSVFPAFAVPGVYVTPLLPVSTGGFGVQMMVNNQGPFLCEIDTGSTNLMVPGNSIACPTCHANPGIAPDPKPKGSLFRVVYGSGRILDAHAYTTSVQPYLSISDKMVPAATQTMGLITKVEGNDNSAPILGMAQPVSPMPYGLTTYMQSLVKAGVSKDLGFMLALCPSQLGSEMVLGGVDPRLQNVAPITVPLIATQDHYMVTPTAVSVAGEPPIPLAKPYPAAIVDSGNQNIGLPEATYRVLVGQIQAQANQSGVMLPASFWNGESARVTRIQLAQLPVITIRMANGATLSIPPQFYIPRSIHNPKLRTFMIRSYTANRAALGDPVLSTYAVYFNRSTQTVSFYPNASFCHSA